ncbi:hypothetical protein [Spirosoma endbachense]|uniref:Uncharacterized protein n=1 Tax=Spirosoma endbachense TaxID=2666025 RepID=A0A6P1W0Z2_9BACT|nr:hypothetical protein [Spirosoma endbachense]QHV97972.1 hypothetical protein GJR95_24480 [Spirosoma endbachense]
MEAKSLKELLQDIEDLKAEYRQAQLKLNTIPVQSEEFAKAQKDLFALHKRLKKAKAKELLIFQQAFANAGLLAK